MDQDTIERRHKFAQGLYAEAISQSQEVEKLFTADFAIPADRADATKGADIKVIQPAQARAIVEKFITLNSAQARQKKTVLPKDNGLEEQEKCSLIEQWLHAYQRGYVFETKKNPWRDDAFWYYFRGRSYLEARFDPSFIGKGKLPFRTLTPDPNTVFPVWGEDGIGYYTKCYTRYAWDLQQEYERRRKGDKKYRWQPLALGEKDEENEEVEIVEYWDDEHCGALVNGELAYLREHEYGCVPLAEARCMDTPLASMEWAFQSVLAPVMNSLKNEYALAAKMAEGANLMYWPKIIVTTSDGRVYVYDLGTIGVDQIPPGAQKVDVVTPTPNAAVLAQSMAWFQGDVSRGTLPNIAWGNEPQSLESGFAINQVLNQVRDKIEDKKLNLELQYGQHDGHILKLVEKFGAGTGVVTRVPAEVAYGY